MNGDDKVDDDTYGDCDGYDDYDDGDGDNMMVLMYYDCYNDCSIGDSGDGYVGGMMIVMVMVMVMGW